MEKNILEELRWRGLLKQVTNEKKILKVQKLKKGVYFGIDPTNDSLHIGHLIQIILLKHFKKFGFKPIIIIGGGTGMIGDPSGKKKERILLNNKIIKHNIKYINKQIKQLIEKKIKIINNNKWLKEIKLINFLRNIGKKININYLLAKKNISTRIKVGISYTEFTYTLLQAYDFYKLYINYDCIVQIGGSDQWGNITSGIDYIYKKIGRNNLACGLTINLLTKSNNLKFGKTESDAIWLNKKKTSPYEFYQFFFNQNDQETKKLLRYMTMLSEKEIINIEEAHKKEPKKRIIQKKLSEELTLFVHKKKGLKKAQIVSNLLFKNNIYELSKQQLNYIYNNLPVFYLKNINLIIVDLLIQAKIVISKRQGREFLEKGVISINGKITKEKNLNITINNFLFNKYLIIRKGKQKYFLIYIKNKKNNY